MNRPRSLLALIVLLTVSAINAGAASTADQPIDFVSAASGDWEAAATWGDVGIPGPTSTVLIKADHTVTLRSNVQCKGLYSDTSSTHWAVLNGTGNLTIAEVFDVEHVSLQTSGTVAVDMTEQGRTRVRDSVFQGLTALNLGVTNKTPANVEVVFERVDFRDFTATGNAITCTGAAEVATADLAFRSCTFSSAVVTYLRINQRGGAVFEDNVLHNLSLGGTYGFWSSAGHDIRDNLFICPRSSALVLLSVSDGPSRLHNNYFYLDTPNPHPIGLTAVAGSLPSPEPMLFTNNTFEVVYNFNGANLLNVSPLIPVRITNNLLLGSGSLVNNVGDQVILPCVVKNNTCYGTYRISDGLLFLAESGDATGGGIVLANNLVTGAPGRVRYGLADSSPDSAQRIEYSDYNNFFNVDTPYDVVTVANGRDHDLSIDPLYVDPSRSLFSYNRLVGGAGNLESTLAAFLAKNGFDPATKIQGTGSGRQIGSLITWVREGYRPTNPLLQSAGDPADQSPQIGCFGITPFPPSAPGGLANKPPTDSVIEITWHRSLDDSQVVGYRVYRDGVLLGTTSTTRFVDSGLSGSTRYTYQVSALDDQNLESPRSQSLEVQTKAGYQPPFSPIPDRHYTSVGIGGGGGMISISMSPYSPLWFIGTDMGVIYRSPDEGRSWQVIDQSQAWTTSTTKNAGYFGFSADPSVVFFANEGRNPLRSTDTGITWNRTPIPLLADERILYWYGDSENPDFILACTTRGVFRSQDKGGTWQRVEGMTGSTKGTFIDLGTPEHVIYHATEQALFRSLDHGATFLEYHVPAVLPIHAFAGGRDASGRVLALVDGDGANACTWVSEYDGKYNELTPERKQLVYSKSGFIWVSKDTAPFTRTSQWGTRFLRMAENDSQTIYSVGDYDYPVRGTQVLRSLNAGADWQLVFDQLPGTASGLWPADRLEYSAIGLDVGYWDNSYLHFSVNRRNSSILGGTGFFFLHTSRDKGEHWESPFTHFEDAEPRLKDKRWSSVGLEMTGVYRLKFHPSSPLIGYAAIADVRGAATEDGGKTWRIANMSVGVSPPYNSFYDYAFKPDNDKFVLGAADSVHGWPYDSWGQAYKAAGGVFSSNDRGRTWTRITPNTDEFNGGFLSVAYDPVHGTIYAGSRSAGVARSTDGGANWQYINDGLFAGNGRMIPQLEVNSQGNVYALLSGDYRGGLSPSFTNQPYTGIYFLDVGNGSTTWQSLRGTVNKPAGVGPYEMWWYPTCFAIDPNDPNTLWLGDYELHGTWLATGVWKSVDRGATWNRSIQSTHVTSITLDRIDPNKVYTSGLYNTDGSWGEGGALYSLDGGANWRKNCNVQVRSSLYSQTLDPNDPTTIYYTTWGMGILHGPRPELLPDPDAPTRPPGLSATAISDTEVRLSWNPSSDAAGVTGYNVYCGPFTGYKVASTPNTTFTVSGLSPNTQYYFQVSAFDAAGNDSGPTRRSATTLRSASDTTAPTVPTGLAGTATSATAIRLTWTASTDPSSGAAPASGVAGYRIYRGGAQIGTATSTTYTDTGLTTGTTYSYQVVAVDAAGNASGFSAAIDAVAHDEAYTSFATWVAGYFTAAEQADNAVSGPDADPDGCGLTNFARYAFALPARGPVANPVVPGTADTFGGRVLTLTFPRRSDAADLNYRVEASTDLVTWLPVPDHTYTPGTPATVTAEDIVPLTAASTPRRFLRVRVTVTP